MKQLSVSQVKTFVGSKSKRAGQYILGIKEEYSNEDAFALGHLAENFLITGEDDYSLLENRKIYDSEKLIKSYDAIKHNSIGLNIPKGDYQKKVEGELLGQSWVGYLDIFTPDCIYDIKTTQYTSKEDGAPNMRSGMSSWEEYKLQLWVYMKLTGVKKSQIIEIGKHQYKDGRINNQLIDFELTPELDQEMTNKYQPVVQEMSDLFRKYNRGQLTMHTTQI